jgi:hypothetical protein
MRRAITAVSSEKEPIAKMARYVAVRNAASCAPTCLTDSSRPTTRTAWIRVSNCKWKLSPRDWISWLVSERDASVDEVG